MGMKNSIFYKLHCPVMLMFVGMAGSGKTSLISSLHNKLKSIKFYHYVVNLDPLVISLPYVANFDIRDTISIEKLIKHYNLGPNSAVLVSISLFISKFNQIIEHFQKLSNNFFYCLIDTPGQMDFILWSISGLILSSLLKFSFKSLVIYLIDIYRCYNNGKSFTSNFLICLCILFKTKCKTVIVINKFEVKNKNKITFSLNRSSSDFIKSFNYSTSIIKSFEELILTNCFKQLNIFKISNLFFLGINDFFNLMLQS